MSRTITDLKMWLKVYHITMVLVEIAITFFIALGCIYVMAGPKGSKPDIFLIVYFSIIVILYFIFGVGLHLIGAHFAGKDTKLAYYFLIVTSALGLASFFTILPCIYFLVQLTKPEIKQHYGLE